jgi:molybdenum cofactor biosynthesis enzyme MoaA
MLYGDDMKTTSFEIAPTTYCQARCYPCQRCETGWTGKVRSDLKITHMPIALFNNIVTQIFDTYQSNKITHIRLCGDAGDPMMHPDIEQFVKSVLVGCQHVGIHTNGGLRQPAWYTHAGEAYGEHLYIMFGIDGTDHDTNWKYREGVDWQRAMDNMLAFKKAGGYTIWQFVIFPWNLHQIEAAAAIANDNSIKMKFIVNDKDGPGELTEFERNIALQKIKELGFI